MLGFFKGKSKDNIIYSPCKGKVVPITEVSDPTFFRKGSWRWICSNPF